MDLDAKATQSGFGRLVGISQPAVSKHLSSGVLRQGLPYRQWLLDYCEDLRSKAAGHRSDDGLDLTRERVLTERVDRQLKELQVAEKTGQLVPREAVQPAWDAMVIAFRAEALSMSDKIKSDLDALHGIDIDIERLNDYIHECLTRLAAYDPDGEGDDPPGSEERQAA